MVLLFGAAIILFITAWRGWCAGIFRALASLLALICAGWAGYSTFKVASTLTGVLATVVVFVVVYFIISLIGIGMFKKTSQKTFRSVRLIWGLGGAVFGFAWGIVILWSLVPPVRMGGAAARGLCTAAYAQRATPPRLAEGLAAADEALKIGPAGHILANTDIIPAKIYATIEKVSRAIGDPQILTRIIEDPAVQDIVNHPAFIELLNDPSISEPGKQADFASLFSNPAMIKVATNPDITEKVLKADWMGILNKALNPEIPQTQPDRITQ